MSDYSYPVLDEGMGQALETLASVLLQKGETLAVAESCTGGLLAGYITGLAGSSQFFKGGVVSYTDEVKERVLEVPARVLEQFGAVSSPVARAMAEGGNVLLLDEPTNDLDVNTLRALEDALENFAGSAVIVSHDRWFLDRVATHILAFEEDGSAQWIDGNYAAYREDLRRRKGAAADQPHRLKHKTLKRPTG